MKPSHLLTGLFAMLSMLAAGQAPPPNIVLIITDQHSGLILNQRGYPNLITPGIDKIADQGVMFTRSYCTNPVCTSSRKSFMTGRMPGLMDNLTDHPSIGKRLRDAGYETAYFGKWHVGSTDMDEIKEWHGFQTYIDGRNDTEISAWSRNFLKQTHDKPFFMVTSFLNPHDCCELARNIAGDNDKYHDGPVKEHMDTANCPPLPANFAIPVNEAEGFYGRRNQDPGDNYWSSHPTKLWTEVEWRQYLYGYDRLVEKVDAHIEDLYDELNSLGMLDNTVIIYTSDHGDGHAAHRWNQKKTFYEESVNIPFLISWKGQSKAGVIDEQIIVSNGLDMYPTILGLAGLTVPTSLPGVDLRPRIIQDYTGSDTISREYVISEINQKIYTGHTPGTFTGRMLVGENFKYILFDRGVNREQLFDLAADPGELYPVTDNPEYADNLAYFRARLKEWADMNGDDFVVEHIIAEYEENALLDDLKVNNTSLKDFQPGRYFYSVDIDTSRNAVISALPVNSGVTTYITPPEDIYGDSAAQKARILVISKDGLKAQTYFIQISGNNAGTDILSESQNQVKVFPNPASNLLNIECNGIHVDCVKIHNILGQVVCKKPELFGDQQLSVEQLGNGLYWLVIESEEETKVVKFIKSD